MLSARILGRPASAYPHCRARPSSPKTADRDEPVSVLECLVRSADYQLLERAQGCLWLTLIIILTMTSRLIATGATGSR